MGDDGSDIRWLTYVELGKSRIISTASAKRLAFRRKWRRQGGNDGTVRVAVPVHEAKPQTVALRDDRDDDRSDIIRIVSALEVAVSTSLREQLERERERSDQAETRTHHAEARADRAEEARDKADARAGRAATERVQATIRADALQATLDQARQAAEQRIDAAEARAMATLTLLRDAGEALKVEKAARTATATEAARLRQVMDQARAEAEQAIEAARAAEAKAEQLHQIMRQARAEALDALQTADSEATHLQQAVEQARSEAQEALRTAEAETAQLRQAADQARTEAEQATQAASAAAVEVEQLRQTMEQAGAETETARAAAQALEPAGRAAMMAARIDQVQFRRLQEAEQTRKSLGRLVRLKAAWRGE
jgi:chromosome segregation ATPase